MGFVNTPKGKANSSIELLDKDGFFVRGPHIGKSLTYVVRRNPGYLRFILSNASIASLPEKDKEQIKILLHQYCGDRY